MLVFALKTRKKIQSYGKSNILWKKVKVIDEMEPPQDVEAWVSENMKICGFDQGVPIFFNAF